MKITIKIDWEDRENKLDLDGKFPDAHEAAEFMRHVADVIHRPPLWSSPPLDPQALRELWERKHT